MWSRVKNRIRSDGAGRVQACRHLRLFVGRSKDSREYCLAVLTIIPPRRPMFHMAIFARTVIWNVDTKELILDERDVLEMRCSSTRRVLIRSTIARSLCTPIILEDSAPFSINPMEIHASLLIKTCPASASCSAHGQT